MAKQVQKLFGGGGGRLPRGAGLGAKLLGAAALVGIGISQSMYTGQSMIMDTPLLLYVHCMQCACVYAMIYVCMAS